MPGLGFLRSTIDTKVACAAEVLNWTVINASLAEPECLPASSTFLSMNGAAMVENFLGGVPGTCPDATDNLDRVDQATPVTCTTDGSQKGPVVYLRGVGYENGEVTADTLISVEISADPAYPYAPPPDGAGSRNAFTKSQTFEFASDRLFNLALGQESSTVLRFRFLREVPTLSLTGYE